MSSDPNLLDTTEFERRLLEAAGSERPSAELSARMAGALGLPPGPGLGPLPTAKLASGWLSLGVIAAALGGAAYGTWALLRPSPEVGAQLSTPAPRSVDATVAAQAPSRVIEATPAAGAPVAAARPAPATGNAAPASPREGKPASEAVVSERGDLREEIRAIDAVRGALAARTPARALSLLRQYSSNFPSGTFAQEATVLRIEALEQSGEHQRAQALSRDFQSKHPNSPLSERLSRLGR